VPRHGKALVVENGIYGERVSAILAMQGKDHDAVRSPWTEAPDLAAVEARLRADQRLTHVVAVHHETTTGRLNDVAALGALCRRYGVALLLDAVSSFGGERLDLAAWNVAACASTANKCLHGVPGVCFVLAARSALESRPSSACSLYLDLHRNYEEQRKGYPLFTPSVQALYALQEALRELEEAGGWERRHRHYQDLSNLVRSGLAELGVEPLLDDPDCLASMLTSFRLPPGTRFQGLYERLKAAGFVIYAGQQALREAIFRVAVMGDLSRDDMEAFLGACAAALPRRAAPCVAVG
jgi:2-aminoethylphosphonate-pyruvate transaminase